MPSLPCYGSCCHVLSESYVRIRKALPPYTRSDKYEKKGNNVWLRTRVNKARSRLWQNARCSRRLTMRKVGGNATDAKEIEQNPSHMLALDCRKPFRSCHNGTSSIAFVPTPDTSGASSFDSVEIMRLPLGKDPSSSVDSAWLLK